MPQRRMPADLLSWIGLARRAAVTADSLSYGEERIVEIVRSLMGRPRYLLLDEPAAGLNENEARELIHIIAEVPKRFGCGVMLIEHNMQVVMGVCQRIHVIGNGVTLANGTPREIQVNQTVIEAYLELERLPTDAGRGRSSCSLRPRGGGARRFSRSQCRRGRLPCRP